MTTIARIIADFSSIDERDWGQLDHRANPFLSRAFLTALEQSGSVTAEAGWQPHHLALYRDDRLVVTFDLVDAPESVLPNGAPAMFSRRPSLPPRRS